MWSASLAKIVRGDNPGPLLALTSARPDPDPFGRSSDHRLLATWRLR